MPLHVNDQLLQCFLMGLGPTAQASVLSGLPEVVVQAVLAGFVLHGLWGLTPFSPTWSKGNRHVRMLPYTHFAVTALCNFLHQCQRTGWLLPNCMIA